MFVLAEVSLVIPIGAIITQACHRRMLFSITPATISAATGIGKLLEVPPSTRTYTADAVPLMVQPGNAHRRCITRVAEERRLLVRV